MFTRVSKKPPPQNTLVTQARSTSTPLLQRPQLSSPSTKEQQPHTYPAGNAGFNFANIPVLQPKLTIGQPNDKYEQEADRVADEVIRVPDSTTPATTKQTGNSLIQRTCATCTNEYNAAAQEDRPVEQDNLCPKCQLQAKPLAGQITPLVQRESNSGIKEEDEEEQHLQTKPVLQRQTENEEKETLQASIAPSQSLVAGGSIVSGINAIRGGGQPLSLATRTFMEPRFDHNFNNVRIHTDGKAAKTAKQINARAFTVSQNIAFGAGQYQPDTSSGKKLLAHELTHTIQQTGTIQRQTGKTPKPKPKPKNVYDDCTASQKTTIGTAFTNALGYVNKAVSALSTAHSSHPKMSPRVKTMLNQNFHTTKKDDISKIISKFKDIQSAMSSGINFECETDCDKGVGGYVWKFLFWEVGDIHICFKLFNTISSLKQEEVIIHEVAHRHAGVDDEAYHWQPKYKTLSAKDAMDNADSYAVFARRL